MSSTIALLPTVPARVEIPESMNPEEQAKLIGELGLISTEIARVQTRDEERGKFANQRWRAIDARLAKLEGFADTTAQHDLVVLQKQLDARLEESSKLKWWAISIFTTFATSAVVGLIVYYLTSR